MNSESLVTHSDGEKLTERKDQFLTFTLGGEIFALDIRRVREIIQHGPMTTVPLMPDFVRGVINLRGAVVPVIDLQARFGSDISRVGKKTCVVVIDSVDRDERVEFGLLVDEVSEVIDLAEAAIEAPPTFGTPVRRDFIRGMSKVEGRFIVLLDPDKAFDLDEMAMLCESSLNPVAA